MISLKGFTLIILFVICLIQPIKSDGQVIESKSLKNNVQLNGSSWLYFGMYSINYERQVHNSKLYNILINAGAGEWYGTSILKWGSGYSIPVSVSGLYGRGNNYLEVDLGVRYNFSSGNSSLEIVPFLPVIDLGYRYQKRDGKGLIFRSFIGISGIGIGVGKAF